MQQRLALFDLDNTLLAGDSDHAIDNAISPPEQVQFKRDCTWPMRFDSDYLAPQIVYPLQHTFEPSTLWFLSSTFHRF